LIDAHDLDCDLPDLSRIVGDVERGDTPFIQYASNVVEDSMLQSFVHGGQRLV
jgi:hypothetical protein